MKKLKNAIFFVFVVCFTPALLVGCAKEGTPYGNAADKISLGKAHVSKNKLSEAIKEFKIAALLEPNNFDAYYELSIAYYKAKDFTNAGDALKTALKIRPREPKAHNMLGLLFEKEGLFESAKKSFQEALAINKKFGEAKDNLLKIDEARREYGLYRFAIDFLYVLSREYSNGNNACMRGAKKTKAVRNESGVIIRYDVDYEIYLAKEYFDKCSKLLEEAADRITAKPLLDIIESFSAAIQQRQEAIDLGIQGYSTSGDYGGEFEKAIAKIRIADTYYIDAAKKLEGIMEDNAGLFAEKDFAGVKSLIQHYSGGREEEAVILQ